MTSRWPYMTSLDFEKDAVWFMVDPRPRLHAIDIMMYKVGQTKGKYVGRFADDLSEWSVRDMLRKEFGLSEDDDDEEEN